ncbi:aspartic peptidase domain-containing protein [Alternaria alternata]|nr:aspartic peptidase domain-containing protein [Alternaria alternata]
MPEALSLATAGRWLGNDGSWSTFQVRVGTPPQTFEVLPATQAQNVWLPISDECTRLQGGSDSCGDSRGATPFQQSPSPGFETNMSSSWNAIGLYELGLGRNHGITGNGFHGFDRVGLDNFTIHHLAVIAYASPGFWIGQMGLSPLPLNFSETISSPSLISALKEEGHIPSLTYGYQAGAVYRETKVPASLVLGGYDVSRSSEPLTIDINTDTSRALTVGLQDIVVTNTLEGTLSMIENERILAPIDSSIPEIWLPKSVCDRFESAFGLEYHDRTGRYVLTDSARDRLRELDPTLTFTIGTNAVTGGNTTIVQIPYAAFDLQAGYPIFANATNYFPIRRADNESQYAIGRAFLQEAYIGVDFESGIFNVSAAKWDNLEPNIITISKKDRDVEAAREGLSGGAIAGIVIGCVTAMLLCILCTWFFVLKPRRRRRQNMTLDEVDEKVARDALHTDPGSTGAAVHELPAKHGHNELDEVKIISELGSQELVHELPSECVR